MTGKHNDKQEEVRPNREDIIYGNLLYSCRISLEDTHEMEEIEECMTYVYPDYLRKKARVFAYDFGEVEKYEEGEEIVVKNKKSPIPFACNILTILSIIFGMLATTVFILAFL